MATVNRVGRPLSLPEPWLSLAQAFGGLESLASRLAVTPRAIRRWAMGERTPTSRAARREVNALARRRGLSEPWPEESSR